MAGAVRRNRHFQLVQQNTLQFPLAIQQDSGRCQFNFPCPVLIVASVATPRPVFHAAVWVCAEDVPLLPLMLPELPDRRSFCRRQSAAAPPPWHSSKEPDGSDS